MKKLAYILIALLFWAGCNDRPAGPIDQTRLFKIKVDAISFQSGTINQSDTLKIRFTGTVGNTSCFKFSHYQGSNSYLRTDLILWGEETTGSNATCETIIVPLNEEFRVYPISAGVHRITVYQPDGSLLEKDVLIDQ